MMIGNMGAAQIAIKYGARGVNENIVTACASGTNAIGDALRHIQHGANDVIIAGGAEAAVSPLAFAGFCNMKAMSTRNDDPKTASRPFDAERDGFVLSEGAGFIVIEELEHAKKRGAHILLWNLSATVQLMMLTTSQALFRAVSAVQRLCHLQSKTQV